MVAPHIMVGRIARAHGLRGEVGVQGDGTIEHMTEGTRLWLAPPPVDAPRHVTLRSMRPGPKGLLVSFDEIQEIDTARRVVGSTLLANASDLPDVWQSGPISLLGYSVDDETRGPLGSVDDIIITGANDVWAVKSDKGTEVLIPVIDDVVIQIDHTEHRITVRLLPGLIEE